jgi:hypothetical protein
MRIAKQLFGLIGTLCVVMSGTANAQVIDKGVKVGLSFAALPNAGEVIDQIVGAPSSDTTSRVGAAFGGFARFRINDRIGFQPELLFVMKGVKLDERGGGTASVRLNYLEFPLLFRYSGQEAARGTPYAFAGPSFGVKVSTSGKLDSNGQTRDVNVDAAIKSPDVGLAFGGGFDNSRYLIEGRITFGLNDIATDVNAHADSLRNRVVLVLAGVKF